MESEHEELVVPASAALGGADSQAGAVDWGGSEGAVDKIDRVALDVLCAPSRHLPFMMNDESHEPSVRHVGQGYQRYPWLEPLTQEQRERFAMVSRLLTRFD